MKDQDKFCHCYCKDCTQGKFTALKLQHGNVVNNKFYVNHMSHGHYQHIQGKVNPG